MSNGDAEYRTISDQRQGEFHRTGRVKLEMQLATYFVLVGEGAANDCCVLGFSKGSKTQHNHVETVPTQACVRVWGCGIWALSLPAEMLISRFPLSLVIHQVSVL